jgi:hypothetical protein
VNDFYTKNLAALEGRAPSLFHKLKQLDGNVKYEVFAGKDPVDINLLDTLRGEPVYKEPVSETLALIKSFDPYARYPFLCFYGIGNGFFYNAMLHNTGFEHLIVFEPEIELLFIALNLSDFSAAIAGSRLILFCSEDFSEVVANKILNLPNIGIYSKLYDLHLLTPYYSRYQEDIVRVNRRFTKGILQFVTTHGNDANDSLIGIDHFVKNIPQMLTLPPFHQLLKKRECDTAVIVSTGPSLTKQLPILKKIAPHDTNISVDASMPVLEKHGIKPDIVTSLERIELTATFYERTDPAFHKDIVFVHSAVQHRRVLDAGHGQKTIVMRPFGYMMEFEGIREFGYAGIGMSAANVAYEVAFLMGHKQAVFIGQDLAYGDDGTTHAVDHTFGKNDEGFKKNAEADPNSILNVTRYGGDGTIKTNAVWVMFLNYFVNNIAETKGRMRAINATEGGARIEGTEEIAFQTVADTLINRSVAKQGIRLHPNSPEKIAADMTYAAQTLERMITMGEAKKAEVEALFLEVASLCDALEKLNETERLDKVDFKAIDAVIEKLDRFKTVFDDNHFKKTFWETVRSLIIHQELEIAKIVVQNHKSDEERRARNVEFLFAHKYWLFSLAGGINAQLDVMTRAKAAWSL